MLSCRAFSRTHRVRHQTRNNSILIRRARSSNPNAGINKIELCVAHQLLAAGTDDGFVHLWDSRQGQSGGGRAVASLDLRDSVDAAAVAAAERTLGGFQVCASVGVLTSCAPAADDPLGRGLRSGRVSKCTGLVDRGCFCGCQLLPLRSRRWRGEFQVCRSLNKHIKQVMSPYLT